MKLNNFLKVYIASIVVSIILLFISPWFSIIFLLVFLGVPVTFITLRELLKKRIQDSNNESVDAFNKRKQDENNQEQEIWLDINDYLKFKKEGQFISSDNDIIMTQNNVKEI